eukprot:1044091-Pelagomonas_calceolata.AAC.11
MAALPAGRSTRAPSCAAQCTGGAQKGCTISGHMAALPAGRSECAPSWAAEYTHRSWPQRKEWPHGEEEGGRRRRERR